MMPVADRLYWSLLRQRDELRYQIAQQTDWLTEKRAKLVRLEAQITEMEKLRKGGAVSF